MKRLLITGNLLKNKKALKRDKHILIMIGNCHRKEGQFKNAIQYFKLALDIDSDSFSTLFGMADSYRGLCLYENAKKYYEKLLILEPENQSILTRIGDMCVNLGEIEQAKRYYNRTLEIGFYN
jgi:tetratricopeptide (TPR) repeat protein